MSIQSLLDANKTGKDRLNTWNQENITLHQKVNILNKLLTENTMKYRNVVSENNILKAECKSNETSLNELRETHSKYTRLQKNVIEINVSMKQLMNENSILVSQNNNYQTDNNILTTKLNQLNFDKKALQETNHQYEQDLIKIKQQLTEAENKINDLRILNDSLNEMQSFGTPIPMHSNSSINAIHSIHPCLSNSKDIAITNPTLSHSTTQNKSNSKSTSNSDKATFHTFHTLTHQTYLAMSKTDETPITTDNEQSVDSEQKQAGPYWNIPTEYFYDDIEESPLPQLSPPIKSEKLNLHNHFKNDTVAYEIWINSCGHTQNITLQTEVCYDRLYPLLCQRFIEITECCRVPTKNHLKAIILKSYLNSKSNGNNDKFTMKYKEFFKFWKWFKECCQIVKELAYLWDFNGAYFWENKCIYLCNLFCGRERCQKILEQYSDGVFIVRVSGSCKGGLVLTHMETQQLQSKKIKKPMHSLVIRKGPNQYQQNLKSKDDMAELKTISEIIRSSEKLTFIYVINNNIVPKNEVFKSGF